MSNEIGDSIEETIMTNEGHKYTGTLRTIPGMAGLVMDGRGTMHYTNGDVYVGEWNRNHRSGNGTLTYAAEGGVYEGEWAEDKRHGCGELDTMAGSYEGSFKEDERHGMGVEKLPNGEEYTGNFEDNLMQGQGTMTFPNGDYLVGEFVNNATHGQGTFYFANGDIYEGTFSNGLRVHGTLATKEGSKFVGGFTQDGELESMKDDVSGAVYTIGSEAPDQEKAADVSDERFDPTKEWKDGKGTIALHDGKYDGDYQDSRRHGQGVMEYTNGDHYEGEWGNGMRHGKGKMVWYRPTRFDEDHRGWRYIGDFAADKFHGHGKLWYDIEGGKYTGYFEDGRRHGCGKETVQGDTYEGEFVEGKRDGAGILTTRDGLIIKGTFVNGICDDDSATIDTSEGHHYYGEVRGTMKHGDGHLRYSNGDEYNGEFADDLRHGVGLLSLSNGESYQGKWKADVMEGNGTYAYADGTVYDGRMQNGLKHGNGTLIIRNPEGEEERFRVTYRNNILVEKSRKENPQEE